MKYEVEFIFNMIMIMHFEIFIELPESLNLDISTLNGQ